MRRILTVGLCLVLASGIPAAGAGAEIVATDPSPSVAPDAIPSATAVGPSALTPFGVTPAPSAFIEPAWSLIRTPGGPAAREDHTLIVDREGRFAYLFGGRGGRQVFDDLWRLELGSDTWKLLAPRGRRPAARFGHSAVWVDRHGLVTFAGQRGVARGSPPGPTSGN